MTTWLIINPQAGGGEGCDPDDLARRLGAACHPTRREGDAQRLAGEAVAAGVDRLIIAGGDGTFHEAVNGLMDAKDGGGEPPTEALPAVALIPLGTGNDLARSLELPKALDDAIEVANRGIARPMDLIRVTTLDPNPKSSTQNQKPFYLHNAATGGFSAIAREKLDDETKERWGALAYLKAALQTLADVPEFDLTVEADDETFKTTTCAVIVANGVYAGGGMPLVPSADPADRRLNLLIVKSATLFERTATAVRMLFKTQEDDPHVTTRRVRTVTLRAQPTMEFSVDGDPLAETPVRFEIVPDALQVVRPTDDTPRR